MRVSKGILKRYNYALSGVHGGLSSSDLPGALGNTVTTFRRVASTGASIGCRVGKRITEKERGTLFYPLSTAALRAATAFRNRALEAA